MEIEQVGLLRKLGGEERLIEREFRIGRVVGKGKSDLGEVERKWREATVFCNFYSLAPAPRTW